MVAGPEEWDDWLVEFDTWRHGHNAYTVAAKRFNYDIPVEKRDGRHYWMTISEITAARQAYITQETKV